jgi:hypothetical protein
MATFHDAAAAPNLMMGTNGRKQRIKRIGVVFWGDEDGMASLLEETLVDLGYEAAHFRFDQRIPADLDLIFGYAPFGSLAPLSKQLHDLDHAHRPLLAFWLTEPLPNPNIPVWLTGAAAVFRSSLERRAYHKTDAGLWKLKNGWEWLTARGHRFRYIGDLKWLQDQGLLTVLAVSSPILVDYLSAQGLSPIQAYMGAHPSYGADLQLERDIPVLWLGKVASRRRNRLLNFMRLELQQRGIDLMVIDGVENPYVFGRDRIKLLNRTRIVLNLVRTPYDDNSLRFYLSAPNRALIVSEPILRHTPFEPGVHLVEAPIEQLPETIAYYLEHEDECRSIVANAYDLVTEELNLANGTRVILNELETKLHH